MRQYLRFLAMTAYLAAYMLVCFSVPNLICMFVTPSWHMAAVALWILVGLPLLVWSGANVGVAIYNFKRQARASA